MSNTERFTGRVSLTRYFDKYQKGGKVTLTTRYWIDAARFNQSL